MWDYGVEEWAFSGIKWELGANMIYFPEALKVNP